MPISLSVAQRGTSSFYRAFRLWSDGSIDHSYFLLGNGGDCQSQLDCGPVQILGPGGAACTGDCNGDGDVGTADLLRLLANWGECEE